MHEHDVHGRSLGPCGCLPLHALLEERLGPPLNLLFLLLFVDTVKALRPCNVIFWHSHIGAQLQTTCGRRRW
jgi:hypothetical protein